MSNKIGKIVILIIILAVIGVAVWFVFKSSNSKEKDNPSSKNNELSVDNKNEEKKDNTDTDAKERKGIVVFFSATGNTRKVAEYISKVTDSDMSEIVPVDEYTSEDLNYNGDCRANKEQNDENARPQVQDTIDISDYDIIYLGYPIWWGTVPKVILTVLDNYDFNGKTVIPFCTSGSTGISQSENDLKEYNSNINWKNGKRFDSSVSEKEVEEWVKSLDL